MELKLKFDGFKGTVVMKVATNTERMEVLDGIGINIMEIAGNPEKAGEAFQQTSIILKLIRASQALYKEVDLRKGHREYRSFEDLDQDPACQGVIMECAVKSLITLGEDEKKK